MGWSNFFCKLITLYLPFVVSKKKKKKKVCVCVYIYIYIFIYLFMTLDLLCISCVPCYSKRWICNLLFIFSQTNPNYLSCFQWNTNSLYHLLYTILCFTNHSLLCVWFFIFFFIHFQLQLFYKESKINTWKVVIGGT